MTIKRLRTEVSEGVSGVKDRICAQYDDFISKMIKAADRLKEGALTKIDKTTRRHLGELETMESILGSFAENGLDQPKDEIVDQIKNYIDKKPVADDSLYDLLGSLDTSKTLRLTNMRLNHFTSKFQARKQESVDFLKHSLETQFEADSQLCQSFIIGQQAILRSLKSNVTLQVPAIHMTDLETPLSNQIAAQATFQSAPVTQARPQTHRTEHHQPTDSPKPQVHAPTESAPTVQPQVLNIARPKRQQTEPTDQQHKHETQRNQLDPRIGKRAPRNDASLECDRVDNETDPTQLNVRCFGGDKSNIRSLFTKTKDGLPGPTTAATLQQSPELKKHRQLISNKDDKAHGPAHKPQEEERHRVASREMLHETPKRFRPTAAGHAGRRGQEFYRHTGYRDTELKRVLDSDYKIGFGMKKSQYQELNKALANPTGALGGLKPAKPVEIAPLSALPVANPGKKYAANDPRRLYQELKENILWLKSTRSPNQSTA